MKWLFKIGIHKWRHKFFPFADQPFANDPMCCVEGYHGRQCKRCGLESKNTNWRF